jgi:hypothetical protein
MAPTDAATALQSSRPRPSTVRPIIPAIPLPYIQKRKQHAVTPNKTEEVTMSIPAANPPTTTSPPVADIPPAAANGATDAIGVSEVASEPTPVTPAAHAVDNDVEAPVSEIKEVMAEASPAG